MSSASACHPEWSARRACVGVSDIQFELKKSLGSQDPPAEEQLDYTMHRSKNTGAQLEKQLDSTGAAAARCKHFPSSKLEYRAQRGGNVGRGPVRV